MLNIIIFGAPGCGKGTQSELLIEAFNLRHISAGQLLREEIAANTEVGREAEKYVSKGHLVPDNMINGIIENIVCGWKNGFSGIIFDGYPRTLGQAEELEKIMDKLNKSTSLLIDLRVPEEELIKRLLSRAKTSGRSDDNIDIIRNRFKIYESETRPVMDFYKSLGKYHAVEGLSSVEGVFANIKEKIESLKR